MSARTERSAPTHYASAGHAMLALPPTSCTVCTWMRTWEPRVNRPAMRRTDLMAELVKVRRRGYPLSWDENDDDVTAITVSVPNALGIHIALNCAIPTSRMTRRMLGARRYRAPASARRAHRTAEALPAAGTDGRTAQDLVSRKILEISSILATSSSALATPVLPFLPAAPASLVASLKRWWSCGYCSKCDGLK